MHLLDQYAYDLWGAVLFNILMFGWFVYLMVMYLKLSKKEEQVMIAEFGDQYLEYISKVPRFIPSISRNTLIKENHN